MRVSGRFGKKYQDKSSYFCEPKSTDLAGIENLAPSSSRKYNDCKMFKPVLSQIDFPAMEREILKYWHENNIIEKYLRRNGSADKRFSFLDGPITANNQMGVHHAWGRTYKDIWQRFYNMRGFRERFQNGFDEQGLWVEVEVEKELGLKSKRDIENLVPGDKFASLEKFVNLCKERVKKFSAIQTEQSKRLGYFMDWDNSYHTSSDQNNYSIWNFLKVVNNKGWLYKGRDSVPWCPRCGTAISQHEILTEEYKELTHTSIYFKLPVTGKQGVNLLIWTTTPWTIPANVAVAVDSELAYVQIESGGESFIVVENVVPRLFPEGVKRAKYKGRDMTGWEYQGPFDDLPAVKEAFGSYHHRVIVTDPLILPISTEEGTGLVHIAPGAGAEDFALGKNEGLPVIGPINESGVILDDFSEFSGKTTKEVAPLIVNALQNKGLLFKTLEYTHRYPVCWRCKTELLWRAVDEWYISMDKTDDSNKTYREQMIEMTRKINWMPKWGLERELDWLKNMHDWLISKKRYWGLSLPIWECPKCGSFEVIGSWEELQTRAVEGWGKFQGHSPHRPWIDQVKIKCSKCGEVVSRIPDVGNPWLDAGIVSLSTMPEDWFPADFVTESFPGQFKNWFYSLIAMSTNLKRTNPFKNLLGYALVIDEKGEPMHKSSKNFIPFDDGVEKIGADVMRWIFSLQNPENNLPLTFELGQETKRRFYLILWNSYKFFVDYAVLAGNTDFGKLPGVGLTVMDRWIISRLMSVVSQVNQRLEKYGAATPARAIESFVVNDFSTWYIRRSRGRVGLPADKEDEKIFLNVSYWVLTTLSKLLAPFMPFISEEIYRNLTGEESVHLSDYPQADETLIDRKLTEEMELVRMLAEIGHAQRKNANIKLRQPLAKFTYYLPQHLDHELEKIMAEELNVKYIEYKKLSGREPKGEMNTTITQELRAEGEARELIRHVQQLRKEQGLTLKDKIKIKSPMIPSDLQLVNLILHQTNALDMTPGSEVTIEIVNE